MLYASLEGGISYLLQYPLMFEPRCIMSYYKRVIFPRCAVFATAKLPVVLLLLTLIELHW